MLFLLLPEGSQKLQFVICTSHKVEGTRSEISDLLLEPCGSFIKAVFFQSNSIQTFFFFGNKLFSLAKLDFISQHIIYKSRATPLNQREGPDFYLPNMTLFHHPTPSPSLTQSIWKCYVLFLLTDL